jgi:acyl phosphate:glycerol-3-phosphate acyltransferase
MSSFLPLICLIISYLLGSIPTSVWVGKAFFKTDVRDYGSGNAGATNAIRVLGWKAGIMVMLIDVSKAIAAVSLVYLIPWLNGNTALLHNLQALMGLSAIIGHIFPVFAGFRGGKGVATVFGAMIVISFPATLMSFGVFAITIALTRYVSLGSILAGVMFPIGLILILKVQYPFVILFALVVPLIILVTHIKNIIRLFKNEENKFTFRSKTDPKANV